MVAVARPQSQTLPPTNMYSGVIKLCYPRRMRCSEWSPESMPIYRCDVYIGMHAEFSWLMHVLTQYNKWSAARTLLGVLHGLPEHEVLVSHEHGSSGLSGKSNHLLHVCRDNDVIAKLSNDRFDNIYQYLPWFRTERFKHSFVSYAAEHYE